MNNMRFDSRGIEADVIRPTRRAKTDRLDIGLLEHSCLVGCAARQST
jgi:hypothetical protein